MKIKILILLIILSSFFGYLEWGKDSKMFLIEGEIDIISKLFSNPGSVLHPFIILPLLGQALLIITLFQTKSGKTLSLLGISFIALLILMITFISVISLNYKMFLSTIPFIILSVMRISLYKKDKKKAEVDL